LGLIEKYDPEDFNNRLGNQAEFCARKIFEFLKKEIGTMSALEIHYLAMSAEIFLDIRDKYGKK
jgi:hypothetical protein